MFYTLVDDIADIDLTRHALIEASAGTGKTYTLENMVVRLLKERPDITLENILIVTFTEKATSELKTRIQEKLDAVRSVRLMAAKMMQPSFKKSGIRWMRLTALQFIRSTVFATRS